METVILTIHDWKQLLREAMDTGVHGSVLKSDFMRRLVAAAHSLLNYKRYLSPGTSGVSVPATASLNTNLYPGRPQALTRFRERSSARRSR